MPHPDEKSIFLTAVEMASPTERAAYLNSACGEDHDLRVAVEALLTAHDRPAPQLDRPIVERPSTIPKDFGNSNSAPSAGHAEATTVSLPLETKSHLVGQTIGAYRLMEQIGEGGFGLVFVAQQMQSRAT